VVISSLMSDSDLVYDDSGVELPGRANAVPIYFDSHMHTPLCKHAYGQPIAYARNGMRRGLKGIIMTCHSPMPDKFSSSVRMSPEEFPEYLELVRDSAEQLAGQFLIRLGLESDWFPGMERWLEELHGSAPFHYILGSVHPFLPEYKDKYFHGDVVEFQKGYFGHLADAAETGLFDCLSHPDIVKVMTVRDYEFGRLEEAVDAALLRIKRTGISMELNTSGWIKQGYPEVNPGPAMLGMMARHGIPVVIGSDSHRPERVAADFEPALDMLLAAGYETVNYYEERLRCEVPIAAVRESLRRTLMYAEEAI
jgi:histidinol-phosphatase (PHP family)